MYTAQTERTYKLSHNTSLILFPAVFSTLTPHYMRLLLGFRESISGTNDIIIILPYNGLSNAI